MVDCESPASCTMHRLCSARVMPRRMGLGRATTPMPQNLHVRIGANIAPTCSSQGHAGYMHASPRARLLQLTGVMQEAGRVW